MVGERWHWWTRQQGVGGKVWFREVWELRLEVRLWVKVRDVRQMGRLWRMGDCRQGRWRENLKTGVGAAVKAARCRVGTI